jgi:DNA repair protein RadA/Sms
MAKTKVKYICNKCGANHNSWAGRCIDCGEWNSLEQALETKQITSNAKNINGTKLAPADFNNFQNQTISKRFDVGIKDVNDVFGGGIVPGSVTLVAGQPGIGKSTIMLQIAEYISNAHKVMYISGEESAEQIYFRAKRVASNNTKLAIASSSNANNIATTILSGDYDVIVIDSIQTIAMDEIVGIPGSVSQVSNCAQLLTASGKNSNTAIVIVGHVTKEGNIAGPKVLEHLVDTVLNLEGDRYGGLRILRAIKNRYGNTNEASILEMAQSGLRVVDNPSLAMLSERQLSDGSIVLATLEGSRPLLVEVQALVNKTSYGYPKRASSGFDLNRLNLLIAMLEKRTKINLGDKDIYVNIVGGIKISEPAADLAVCLAIASADRGMQLKTDAVVFGEVGLSGEIRKVSFMEKRIAEAKKMGFKQIIGPNSGEPAVSGYMAMSDLRTTLNNVLKKG